MLFPTLTTLPEGTESVSYVGLDVVAILPSGAHVVVYTGHDAAAVADQIAARCDVPFSPPLFSKVKP